jgi:hypothetical protein
MSHNPISGCAEGVVISHMHRAQRGPLRSTDPGCECGPVRRHRLEVCSNTTGNPHEYFDHTLLLQRVDVLPTSGADALADADRL